MPAARTYPRTRFRPLSHPCTYVVQIQLAARGSWRVVGKVQRFGSLPSMRGWQALLDGNGATWTRKRPLRSMAVEDLLAEWRARQ